MSEDPKIIDVLQIDPAPALADPNRVPVVFVSEVYVAGFLNGVVNLTFGTAQFTPMSNGKVTPDMICASRLRMDLMVAMQLRDHLNNIIDANTKGPAQPAPKSH